MKKILFIFLAIMLPLFAEADAVEIDGIYYNLISKAQIAEVTSNPDNYTGDIVIPPSISYDGVQYNVESVGKNAFYRCYNLKSVTIPNTVKIIDIYAFCQCSNLSSIVIPNSVETIGDRAFDQCYSLKSITIGNGVKYISESAFSQCNALTSVNITDLASWLNINFGGGFSQPLYYACHLFLNGQEIHDLIIPDGVKVIGNFAFYRCFGLTSVKIPHTVTTIGSYAFDECINLTSIDIPHTVTTIGSGAFEGCKGLKDITLPLYLKELGYAAFGGCNNLTSINIPSEVSTINESVFAGCKKLTTLTIPDNVVTIMRNAFSGCTSLATLTIGKQVSTIEECAFSKCQNLANVIYYRENPPFRVASDIFQDSYIEFATLHVPAASVNEYKKRDPWNKFKNILAIDGEIPEPPKCATPTISYTNGQLKFDCENEGAVCHYTLADNDIETGIGNIVPLTATYNISVYAAKEGYENSDVATATLCWIDAEPKQEGTKEAEDGVTEVKAIPVLIQAEGNIIMIQGAAEGTEISAYNANGIKLSSTIANKGITTLSTQLPSGSTAIVKIGEKAVKVLVK